MKIKNREKFLTIAAISAVVILAGDRLVISPLVRAWKARTARISELTKSLSKGNLLLSREKSVKNKWDTMKRRALSSNVSVAQNDVLKAVDRWAKASAIGFNGIKSVWKPSNEDYMTLECRADASGGIESLARFLYELEKDPLALKIEDIEITARDSAGQLLSLGVRFSGLLLATEER